MHPFFIYSNIVLYNSLTIIATRDMIFKLLLKLKSNYLLAIYRVLDNSGIVYMHDILYSPSFFHF